MWSSTMFNWARYTSGRKVSQADTAVPSKAARTGMSPVMGWAAAFQNVRAAAAA